MSLYKVAVKGTPISIPVIPKTELNTDTAASIHIPGNPTDFPTTFGKIKEFSSN